MKNDPLPFKSPEEIRAKAVRIAGMLHGFPMSQALNVLKQEAVAILLSSHTADAENPRFRAFEEHAAQQLSEYESELQRSPHSFQSDDSLTPCPDPQAGPPESPLPPQGQSPTDL